MHVSAAGLAAGPLDTAIESVSRVVPEVLGFVAILAAGWLTATLLRRLTTRLLHRVGFTAALERGGLTRLSSGSSYDPAAVLSRGVYYAILLIALTLAFGVFGDNPASRLLAGVVAFLPKAAVAGVIVLASAAIARAARELINSMLGALSYSRLLANAAGAFVLGLGVIAALNQIGVATTVTTPVLIAVLATVGGVLVVGVGGGLIQPMQQRWERWLAAAEHEGRNLVVHPRPATMHSAETAHHAAEQATAYDPEPAYTQPQAHDAEPVPQTHQAHDPEPVEHISHRGADDDPTQELVTVPGPDHSLEYGDYSTGR